MQDHIGGPEHTLGSQETRSRAKEREHFGGATTFLLMWLQDRVTFWLRTSPQAAGWLDKVQLHPRLTA